MTTATDTIETEDMTAESMPGVRRGMKALGVAAFAILWFSAMAMTFAVMMGRAEGEAWYVALGLVALGLGADFWVGAGPIILKAASKWKAGAWVPIGWAALIMALLFSFTNKVSYWEDRATARAVKAEIAAVDPAAADRAFLQTAPPARDPGAIAAEISGLQASIEIKDAEIAALPPEWPTRTRQALREKAQLAQQKAALESELVAAKRVADARARVEAASAPRTAEADKRVDPMIRWIVGIGAMLGVTVSEVTAKVVLHAAYAFFHEAFQMIGLGLATLRVPERVAEREMRYMLRERERRMTQRVRMTQLAAQERTEKITAAKLAQAKVKKAKELAVQKAEFESERDARALQVERRVFERQCQLEDMIHNGDASLMGDDRALPDLRNQPPVVINPQEIQAQFVDAARSEASRRGWEKRKRKIDERAPALSENDPRVARAPAPPPPLDLPSQIAALHAIADVAKMACAPLVDPPVIPLPEPEPETPPVDPPVVEPEPAEIALDGGEAFDADASEPVKIAIVTDSHIHVEEADVPALEAALAGGADLDETLAKLGYARGVAAE